MLSHEGIGRESERVELKGESLRKVLTLPTILKINNGLNGYAPELANGYRPEYADTPMFHFTRKRIEAHICICFVALKVYKELERMLKASEISVVKVLALAKTITTIQIKLPLNKEVHTQTMQTTKYQKIAKLFDEEFWVTQ